MILEKIIIWTYKMLERRSILDLFMHEYIIVEYLTYGE